MTKLKVILIIACCLGILYFATHEERKPVIALWNTLEIVGVDDPLLPQEVIRQMRKNGAEFGAKNAPDLHIVIRFDRDVSNDMALFNANWGEGLKVRKQKLDCLVPRGTMTPTKLTECFKNFLELVIKEESQYGKMAVEVLLDRHFLINFKI